MPSAVPNWPQASGPVLQWVRIRSGPNSRTGRAASPNTASRPWSVVASVTIASASSRSAAATAMPSSGRSPTASKRAIIRSTAQPRLTAVGRAARSAAAAARRIARRAIAVVSVARSAERASPMAATWPIAGAPRTTIWRIAFAASGAFRTSTSTSSSGSFRWSMTRRKPPSSRNGVRNPVGGPPTAGGGDTATWPAAVGSLRSAAAAGSRIAPAASADARCSAWAAPATVAAVWISSPANWRKKRRRARLTSSSGDAGSGAAGEAVAGGAGSPDGSANRGRSVLDDARDPPAVEPVTALQEVELDEEREADDVALQALDELDRALDRAARREEIVDDQDLLAGLDCIAVDLERVGAVLEGVLDGDRLGRQLAELPDGDEAGVELVRHRRAEDEATRFHPDHDVDRLALVGLEHQVDRLAVGGLVLQQRRDVVEEDPGLREVGDLADLCAKLLCGHRRAFLQAGPGLDRGGPQV